jgi:hypothetical protein
MTALSAHDRCDRCGSPAYVRVTFRTGVLLFCGHHARVYRAAILPRMVDIHSELDRLDAEHGPNRVMAGDHA